jgi:hypothetical protein
MSYFIIVVQYRSEYVYIYEYNHSHLIDILCMVLGYMRQMYRLMYYLTIYRTGGNDIDCIYFSGQA